MAELTGRCLKFESRNGEEGCEEGWPKTRLDKHLEHELDTFKNQGKLKTINSRRYKAKVISVSQLWLIGVQRLIY